MDTNDRKAIEDLFQKLSSLERDMPQRDAEAERFIGDQVSRQPGSPYYMAQTIVMQQMALENQQRELETLARRRKAAAMRARSRAAAVAASLSRMFGGGGGEQPRQQPAIPTRRWVRRGAAAGRGATRAARARRWRASRHDGAAGHDGRRGGRRRVPGGAAQTAHGCRGRRVLLGNAIAGMFDGGGEAQAAEAAAPAAEEPQVEQTATRAASSMTAAVFDEEI